MFQSIRVVDPAQDWQWDLTLIPFFKENLNDSQFLGREFVDQMWVG